jgi:hypothetical protein
MSLINDALKKAQRDRTGGAPANVPVPGGGSRPPVEVGRPAAFRLQILLLGGGALLGLLIATGALFLSRRETPAAKPEAADSSAVAKTGTAAPTADNPASVAPPPASTASSSPAPATSTPPAPRPEEPALAVVKTTPAAEPVVSTAPVPAASGSGAAPKPSGEPPAPSSRMVNACEALRVTGIRASGTDSKVLMNDRVYRVGDTVDYELGIKLTAATASSLTFTDPTGATYTRYF